MVKGNLGAEATEFFSWGAKSGPKSRKPFFQKCHEAHQIDQRNVLNAKMYVMGGGGGGKNHCFFQRSKFVKIGQNWSAQFGHRHFVIGGGGRAAPPPPPLNPSLTYNAH